MATLKYALRTLTQTPFVTAVAVLSLALGIGANAAIFSIFDRILLRPLPVHEPDRLVNLGAPGPKPGATSCNTSGSCEEVFSYPMFRDLEAAGAGFSGIAAHVIFGANLAYGDETVSASGLLVSGSYFPVLGLQPEIGRLLAPADDQVIGEHSVAVLSHGYWERRLGSDPGVLNDTLVINGQPMTIVGVAPRGFEGTTLGAFPDVFVPITMRGAMSAGFNAFEDRRSYWAYLFGRLDDGVTLERAAAEINTVYSAILNDVEAPLQGGMSEPTMERFRAKQVTLTADSRGQSSLQSGTQTPLTLLLGITGIVLAIACANIANLLLARGASRRQEMAIRGSLGASRGQLLRQLLIESCLLAVGGGLASLLVARWTLGILASLMPPEIAPTVPLELRGSAIGFAALLSIATGLLFGLYPALHATRNDLAPTLRDGSGQPSSAPGAARFRSALVVGQLALSMALLVAAGLFIRSLVNVSRVDLGLEADRIVRFGISPTLNGYEAERSRALFVRAEEELAAIPGVASVSAGRVPLLAGSNWGSNVNVEGFETGPDIDANARFNAVGLGYFATLGIPLLAGREFTEADSLDAPKVVIVNETFTEKFGLDGRRAVGKWMSTGGNELDMEIVGVVQDAKYSQVKEAVPPLFYTPYRQDPRIGRINMVLRVAGDPDPVLRAIPDVVRRLDPNLPVESLRTLQAQIRDNVFADRILTSLAAAFASLATVLAAVGLYGVLAFTVAQRTREIGVRMALGADRRRVRGMVIGQVGRMTVIGGVIGLLLALGIGRAASSLLFELEGHDPLTLVAVFVVLAAVALGAAYLPARRASEVDPMRALRFD